MTGDPLGTNLASVATSPEPVCELDAVSIVFAGNLNPSILQPQWLARHELVGEAEARDATIEIIRPEVVSLKIGPFLINATHERAAFEVASVSFSQLLTDLVTGVFAILGETPVTGVGINRTMHFKMFTQDAWHRVGHALAPKERWEGILDDAGTRSVTLRGTRPGRIGANTQVTVEPSNRIPMGVFFAFNEHAPVASVSEALSVINAHSSAVWEHALLSAKKLVKLGGG